MKRIAVKIPILALLFIAFFATSAWADCHWGESSKDTKGSETRATRPGGSIKRRRGSMMGGVLPELRKKKKKTSKRGPYSDRVDREISRLRGTLWAQTHEGQVILAMLEQMNNEGRIRYKSANKSRHKIKKLKLGVYSLATKDIVIDRVAMDQAQKAGYGASIPGILAHEGAHAYLDSKGAWYGFAHERAAYNHGYAVDKALSTPNTHRASDKWIHKAYFVIFALRKVFNPYLY